MNIRNAIKINGRMLQRSISKESPTILTFLSISGLISTIGLAIKATPKALYIIDREYYNTDDKDPYEHPFSKLEILKLTWKCYIPTVIAGGVTVGCIIGANKINLQRNAALLSLYTLTESSLREYQQKVIEEIGESKERKIRDGIAQDKLDKDPVDKRQVILTGSGETLFYDSLSGRYFKSDFESIRKKINDFNASLIGDVYQTLNEWYDLLNLEPTEMGNVGWEANDGLLEIYFSAKIATSNVPCIVLEYKNLPKSL